jgi:O-antigen/teichoic acid export membrane protein
VSRFSRFARGVGTTMLTQVLLTVTGLWLTPFLLHHLGGADYGLWLLATQLLAYLTLLDLGVVALLPREVATASGAPDDTGARAAVTQAIARALRILALQLPVIAIASLLLWYYLPTQWLGMRDALGVALAGFVLLYPLRAAMGVLEGLQELPFLGRAFLLAWVVGTVTTVILVASGAGLMAVAAGWIVQQSVASVCWVHRLWSRHRALLPRDMQVDRSETRAQLSRGLWFSLSQVATVLLFGTDLLIIGKVLGPAAVIPYAMTTKLMIVLQNQPQLLMHAALPGIAELRGRANHGDVLRVVFGLALGMLMLSGGVATVILAVNRAFVSWWVGPALFGGQGMTALLLLVMLLRHWGLVLTQANFALGDDRYLGLVSLIEGLVSVTASYTLVHFLGAMGAIAGALIGVVLIRIPMQLAELSRRTGRPRAEIVGTLAPLSWRLALMLVVAAVVARFVPVSAPPVHGRDPFVLAVIAAVSAGLGLAYMALMAGVIRGSPLESYAVRVRGAIVGYWASVRTRLAPR